MNLPSFSDAIRAARPDSFVPDLPAGAAPAGVSGAAPLPPEQPSFKETLGQMIGEVKDRLQTADKNVQDYADGKSNDLVKVTTSVEEANLAFQFTIAIQNKLVSAYQEIERMQM